jgi:hypothetical protein
MSVPPVLVDWLNEKVFGHTWASVRARRETRVRWRRIAGGRIMNAEFSASIEPAEQFGVFIEEDIIPDAHSDALKNGAITVLFAQGLSPVLRCQLRFYDIAHDDVHSVYAAYYHAAEEAVETLLGVSRDDAEFNILW